MNAPESRPPGGPEPDDTFDHFFSHQAAPDGEETRPIPQEQQPAAPLPGQPQPRYALASEPAQRRKSAVLPILVIVASLIVVAVVAFLALGHRRGTPATAGATLPSATSTAQPPSSSSPASPTRPSSTAPRPSTSTSSPSPTTSSPSTTPSPTSSAPSPAALPASVQDCHTSTFSVGPKTSCQFGANVAAAAGSADFSHGPVTLKDVYSPETKRTYTLHCDSGGYITCTTGTDAVVYVERH